MLFRSWYSDDKLSNKFDFDTEIKKDISLYAKWIKIATNEDFGQSVDENSEKQDATADEINLIDEPVIEDRSSISDDQMATMAIAEYPAIESSISEETVKNEILEIKSRTLLQSQISQISESFKAIIKNDKVQMYSLWLIAFILILITFYKANKKIQNEE